jgi:AcrR family transcriptional regulator
MEDRRQQILNAALALADDKGLDAVTMRAVAERTGVTPMALYPHVGSKTELLDQMLGELAAEIAPARSGAGAPANAPADAPADTPADADWRERLRRLARRGRRVIRDHPWAAALVFTRPAVTPDMARVTDEVYAALLAAQVPEPEVLRLERMLTTLVMGYAASEAGGRFGTGGLERARRGGVVAAAREGTLPAFAALARWLERPVDWDADFEADLDDLMRVVETFASPGDTTREDT